MHKTKTMRFDLTDMRVFLSAVECGSLTQGARSMDARSSTS